MAFLRTAICSLHCFWSYRELRQGARRYMAGERPGHLLQTTALINEAYLRLVGARKVSWQNRSHFLAICAQLMRRILTDFARSTGIRNAAGISLACPSMK